MGRATGVKLPAVDVYGLGVQATYSRSNYDANGNVVQTIDARGRVLTNEYDAHNRLTKTTDALGSETFFAYDKGNNRLSVTDDNGNVTAFTYDAQNRVKTETYPGSQVLTYGYDKVNKTSRTDALSRQTTYAYDVRNRLTTVTYVSGVQGTRTYGYDDAGQLLSVTESAQPSADVTYTYDALGRVSSEVSYGFTHTYTYDLAGNRIATDYGTGRSETRVFDALNRPLQISEGGRLTDYYYDLAGRAVGLMSGNDQWSVNEYDAQSRLVRRTLKANASGWNPLLAELTFGYDALGNLRRQQESWPGDIARVGVRSTTLSYDSGDRLRQELVVDDSGQKSTDYHYDGVGNRTLKLERTNGVLQKQTSYTSNVRNQLTSWEEENGSGIDLRSTTLGYDVAGNRTSQSLTTHGPVPSTANTSYTWTPQNMLSSVTLPNSSVHSYAYDYRVRRITRTEGSANPVAMTFSGGLSVAEFEVTDSQLGTLNSQPSVEYQRGPDMGGGVGGLLYSLRSGTAKFNLSNGRGDVVAQSDASGDLTWTASYEAYGKRPVETGTNADRQRANTKEEDPTGLNNEGHRMRELETGVWMSRDPAGFVDGPNLYAYVRQNPWSKFDALGLYEIDFHYYAVYHVLRARGYDTTSSNRLAGFSQYVDDSPTTNPLGNAMDGVKNNYHHFFGSTRILGVRRNNPLAQKKLADAFKSLSSGDKSGAYLVGDGFHTLADTFAHEGFSSFWSSKVNTREGSMRPNVGHADAPEGGHAPDRPYNDVDKAIAAAKAIYDQTPVSSAKDSQVTPWEVIESDLRDAFEGNKGDSIEHRVAKMQSKTKQRFGEVPYYDLAEFQKEEEAFSSEMEKQEKKLYPSRAEAASGMRKHAEEK